ncbi:hypothetical protein AMTRI_Chr02g217640 [Amborella trichopoda]
MRSPSFAQLLLFTTTKNETITIFLLFPTFSSKHGPRGCGLFSTKWSSPPPWGWSTRFITTPLTTGRLPSQHLDPALPKIFWFTPTLPTCPTVAEPFLDKKRNLPRW